MSGKRRTVSFALRAGLVAALAASPAALAAQDDAKVFYNEGVSAYQAEDYERAADALRRAAAAASAELRPRAVYNLGNAEYRLGQRAESVSAQQAADHYKQAQGSYRLALRLDPSDEDARFNYELATARLETAEQQQQQAEQQAQQQQGQQASQQPGQLSQEQGQGQGSQQDQGQSQGQQGSQEKEKERPELEELSTSGEGRTQKDGDPRDAASLGRQTEDGEENFSEKEALWILDSLGRQEQRAPRSRMEKAPAEPAGGNDW